MHGNIHHSWLPCICSYNSASHNCLFGHFYEEQGVILMPYDFELTFRYEDQSCIPSKFHWCKCINRQHYLSEHVTLKVKVASLCQCAVFIYTLECQDFTSTTARPGFRWPRRKLGLSSESAWKLENSLILQVWDVFSSEVHGTQHGR